MPDPVDVVVSVVSFYFEYQQNEEIDALKEFIKRESSAHELIKRQLESEWLSDHYQREVTDLRETWNALQEILGFVAPVTQLDAKTTGHLTYITDEGLTSINQIDGILASLKHDTIMRSITDSTARECVRASFNLDADLVAIRSAALTKFASLGVADTNNERISGLQHLLRAAAVALDILHVLTERCFPFAFREYREDGYYLCDYGYRDHGHFVAVATGIVGRNNAKQIATARAAMNDAIAAAFPADEDVVHITTVVAEAEKALQTLQAGVRRSERQARITAYTEGRRRAVA